MPEIKGFNVRELRCKNDNCRAHLGWENVKVGVLVFKCRHCKMVNVFRIKYSKGQENIDMLREDVERG